MKNRIDLLRTEVSNLSTYIDKYAHPAEVDVLLGELYAEGVSCMIFIIRLLISRFMILDLEDLPAMQKSVLRTLKSLKKNTMQK
ncbi:MAG: hypothetical protein ACI9NN_001039 [Bacteroidia bacterium]|jgi:hypothetical protein